MSTIANEAERQAEEPMTPAREARSDPRQPKGGHYSLTWTGADGNTYSAAAVGVDICSTGLAIECPTELPPGSTIYVQAHDGSVEGECEVVHCARRNTAFHIGLAFLTENMWKAGACGAHGQTEGEPDHYEILQISRKADGETLHRVFRIMASRFHPDNPETGDLETFLRMKRSYSVLSDPQRRTDYDATLEKDRDAGPRPIFASKAFVTGIEAEANRRLGVLALLYNQRQRDPDHPSISLLELEREMGFPREYLAFTMWYLRAKEFVVMADNSDFAVSAAGAEFLEKKAARSELMGNLLNPAAPRARPQPKPEKARPARSIGRRQPLLMADSSLGTN